MKYLKYFEELSAYEAYKNGSDYVTPNVSYIEETNDIWYDTKKRIIKFNIKYSSTNIEYQAEEGMTWGEWINSEYNQLMPNSKSLQILSYGQMGTEGYRHLYTSSVPAVTQYPDSVIAENVNYYISSPEPINL